VLEEAHRRLVEAAAESAADLVRLQSAPARENARRDDPAGEPAAASETKTATAVVERPRSEASASSDLDPVFAERLREIALACHVARRPLGLVAIEVCRYVETVFALGEEGARALMRAVAADCERLDHDGAACFETGEARFALVLPDCDRSQAVGYGNELVRRFRERGSRLKHATAIGVGVATAAVVSRNFRCHELAASALRCLAASIRSGANCVKTIEIF
jgi:hypothetical protein